MGDVLPVVLSVSGAAAFVYVAMRVLPTVWRWYLLRKKPDFWFSRTDARPTVLYFYTQECDECRETQEPILESLQDEYPERFSLVKIDAEQDDALAGHYHVVTIPTTIILDSIGKIRGANIGVASRERLESQMRLS